MVTIPGIGQALSPHDVFEDFLKNVHSGQFANGRICFSMKCDFDPHLMDGFRCAWQMSLYGLEISFNVEDFFSYLIRYHLKASYYEKSQTRTRRKASK